MGWKDWPYWLKGGVIGILIFISGFVITLILGTPLLFIYPLLSLLGISGILSGPIPITNIGPNENSLGNNFIPIMALFSILLYLMIGALIGYIYGKIKNAK